ncbi:MAG: ExbD/TolR family protein, partial [Oceanobacter sp.]
LMPEVPDVQPDSASRFTGFSQRQPQRKNIIRFTPLIDVVFILLVFFMLATEHPDWHAIELGDGGEITSNGSEGVLEQWIQLEGDQWRLNGQTLSPDSLIQQLLAQQSQSDASTILIEAVGKTSVQQLVDALDTLSTAGLAPLQLIETSPDQDEAATVPSDERPDAHP